MEKNSQHSEDNLKAESFLIKKSIYNFLEKTLIIIFNDQNVYKYVDVDIDTFEKYKNNISKETAYRMYIKNNFKFENI